MWRTRYGSHDKTFEMKEPGTVVVSRGSKRGVCVKCDVLPVPFQVKVVDSAGKVLLQTKAML